MSNNVKRTFFAFFSFFTLVSIIAIALAISYFLCHIDPKIESGWGGGIWHGFNFVQNFILSYYDGRLLKTPLHTSTYPFFWWLFTISSCVLWCNLIWNWMDKIFKRPKK